MNDYELIRDDCIEHMPEMPENFADFAAFSPPFQAF